MIKKIVKEHLNQNQDYKSVIYTFVEAMEHYQSNHYGNINRKLFASDYKNLPLEVKIQIAPDNTDSLYRGADGIDEKAAISFTNNQSYADSFGYYTIPFSEVKSHQGLICTRKLVKFLDDNNIRHDIGDDEGEVIVINPIFNKSLHKNIEKYRNE